MQIVPQTDEEKIVMYMKCKKKELAEMLLNCNNLLDKLTAQYNLSNDNTRCDVCGNKPNAVIITAFGTYCKQHARYT